MLVPFTLNSNGFPLDVDRQVQLLFRRLHRQMHSLAHCIESERLHYQDWSILRAPNTDLLAILDLLCCQLQWRGHLLRQLMRWMHDATFQGAHTSLFLIHRTPSHSSQLRGKRWRINFGIVLILPCPKVALLPEFYHLQESSASLRSLHRLWVM